MTNRNPHTKIMDTLLDVEPPSNLYKIGWRIYRTLQILVSIAILIAMIWGWQMLHDPEQFPVKKVRIQAPYQHVSQQDLQQHILSFVNRGFFNLNAHQLSVQLLQMPWVASAEVGRIWPDIVTIHIAEQVAVAQWGDQALLNTQGNLFSPPVASFPPHLPQLKGDEQQRVWLWQTYQQLSTLLATIGLNIRQLSSDDRQSLSVTLTNGTQLILGRIDPLLRLQRFVKVYPKITPSSAQAATIDLRYENGFTVKLGDP
ncbi:MAG: cell division protein FtsQ/DivIB [Gammaproteobacteria bacterium]